MLQDLTHGLAVKLDLPVMLTPASEVDHFEPQEANKRVPPELRAKGLRHPPREGIGAVIVRELTEAIHLILREDREREHVI